MALLRFRERNPPGDGFPYTHPVTGRRFRVFPWQRLLNEIAQHERANGIPSDDVRPRELWEREIENKVCEELKEHCPTCCEGPPSLLKQATGLYQEAKRWVGAGMPIPSFELARQRWEEHCSKCPYWQGWTKDNWLGRCTKCGCFKLKLAVPTTTCPDNPPRWLPVT